MNNLEKMNIHRLRVVDYYDTTVSKETKHEEGSGDSRKDQNTGKVKFDTESRRRSYANRSGEQNALSDSRNCPVPTPAKKIFIKKHRSKSELFRLPSQTKYKKPTRKNTSSSEDLKKSSKNLQGQNHRSRYNLFFNRDSILNLHLKGGDNKRSKKLGKKKEEVNNKSVRLVPNLLTKEKNYGTAKNAPNKSSKDMFSLNKNDRRFNPYVYQMSCHFLDTDNLSTLNMLRKRFRNKQSRKKQKQKHEQPGKAKCKHKMRVLKLDDFSSSEDENDKCSYNLIDHGKPPKAHPIPKSYRYSRRRTYTTNNLKKDANVFVSPSALMPITKYCVNRASGGSKYGIPSVKQSRSQNECLKTKSESVSNVREQMVSANVNSITSCKVDLSKTDILKDSMKNICLGLLVIVWSPCLLAVILSLIIIYLCKIANSLGTNLYSNLPKTTLLKKPLLNKLKPKGLIRECQRKCSSFLKSQQKSVLSSVASWFTRAASTAATSIGAMLSLIKVNKNRLPTCAGSSFLPKGSSKMPNAKTKYYLYYTNNRGWVMKKVHLPSLTQNMRCEHSTRMHHSSPLKKLETEKCHSSKDMILEHPKPDGYCEVSQECNLAPIPPKKQLLPQLKNIADESPPSQCCISPMDYELAACQDVKDVSCNFKNAPAHEDLSLFPKSDKEPCCPPNQHKSILSKLKIPKAKLSKMTLCKTADYECCGSDKHTATRLEECSLKIPEHLKFATQVDENLRTEELRLKDKEARRLRKVMRVTKKSVSKRLKAEKQLMKSREKLIEEKFQMDTMIKDREQTLRIRKEKKRRKRLLRQKKICERDKKAIRRARRICKREQKKIEKLKRKRKENEVKEEKKRGREVDRHTYTRRHGGNGYWGGCLARIKAFDKRVFPIRVTCRPMYIHTLNKKPCLWIYRVCPFIYPCVIDCIQCRRDCCRMCCYCISLMIWAPLIYCCNSCFEFLICCF